MSENKKLVPKRRFKEFENADAWEQRELGKFVSLITKGTTPRDKSGSGSINFIKVENISDGIISPVSKISEDEHEGYLQRSKLKENDILISIAGTLGRTGVVDKTILPANTNQALAIIRGYDFDKDFLLTSLNGKAVKDFIRRNPTIGAQPNLSLEQVGKFLIYTPKKEEQIQIGVFFKNLDQTIAFQQRKLEKMKSMKSAYLSEMFPAEGERKPKRRFPGFTDDWKQRELGKVLGNLTDGDWIEKEHISDKGKYRIIQTGNIGIGEYYNKGKDAKFLNQSSFDVLNGNEIFPGDILISRLAEPAGRTIILPNTGSRMVTAVDVAIVRPNSNFSSYFIQTMMNTNETLKKINEEASGSTRKRISRKNLELIDLIIPEIQEQEKIGNFFKNLDQTIAFQQKKLEKLQNIKKAYLNEMFI